MKEQLEIYDMNLNKIGILPRDEVHAKGYLHAVSHLWVTDMQHGYIYYQHRSLNKDAFPGFYDITSAGHIDPNETASQAMVREAKEEIGLILNEADLTFLGRIVEHLPHENEIAYIYTIDIENPIFHLGEEVMGMLKMKISDFMQDLDTYTLIDENNNPHVISKEIICPHDISFVRNYLQQR